MRRRGKLVVAAAVVLACGAVARGEVTAEVENGTLIVRGDGADDEVAVAPTPGSPGMVRVEALVTKVNGKDFEDFAGVRALDVDPGAGDDLLRIGGVGGTRLLLRGVRVTDAGGTLDLGFVALSVRGGVEVALGAGADRFELGDVTISGSLNADLDPRGGGGATDTFGLLNSQIGTMDLFLGPGDEQPTISSSDPSSPTRMKNVLLDLGDGADLLLSSNFEVLGTLRVLGGPGNDTVGLVFLPNLGTPAPRFKALQVDLGDGTNACVLGSSTISGTVVGKAEFAAGPGDDSVTLNEVEVLSTVTVALGAGRDAAVFRRDVVKKGTRIDLGEGDDDRLTSTDTLFFGSFSADGGPGVLDVARMQDGTRYTTVPVFTGFEVAEGPAVDVEISDFEGDRLVVDLASGQFEVFVAGVSKETGTASLKRKGANVSVVSNGPAFPFAAKINVAKRWGKCTVRDAAGAVVATIDDRDSTF